jgi:hypothetical protein
MNNHCQASPLVGTLLIGGGIGGHRCTGTRPMTMLLIGGEGKQAQADERAAVPDRRALLIN